MIEVESWTWQTGRISLISPQTQFECRLTGLVGPSFVWFCPQGNKHLFNLGICLVSLRVGRTPSTQISLVLGNAHEDLLAAALPSCAYLQSSDNI